MSDSNIGACHFFKSPCHLCMEHSSEVGPWVAHPRLNLRHLWLGHCWNEKWRVGMHCSGCLFYWLAGHRCCWTDYRRIHSAKCVAAVFVTGTYEFCGFLSISASLSILSLSYYPLCVPLCPVPLRMTLASPCTQKLMTHPELNPASPASSFRPLIWAYYADCGFGHVRSNVLIKILVNCWRHLLNT